MGSVRRPLCCTHSDERSSRTGTLPEDLTAGFLTPGVFLLDSHMLGKILKSGTKLLISQLERNAGRLMCSQGGVTH